jgi:hypothetical protein
MTNVHQSKDHKHGALLTLVEHKLHKVAVPYPELASLAPSLKKYFDALATTLTSNNLLI